MAERVSIIIKAKDLASGVFGKVSQRLKKIGISARGVGSAFLAVGASIGGVAFGLLKIFKVGSSVLETQSKFNTVFGESASRMEAFVKSFASLAGLSNSTLKDLTATTAAVAQGLGLTTDRSAAFAEAVVRLAADLSSFNNLPTEEVLLALRSAFTGEREPLKRLGIVILDADVNKRALLLTGKKLTSQLTQEEKAIASLLLIQERAGKAVGDLDRTQTSAANKAKRLGAEFRTIGERIAANMIPALEQVLPLLASMAELAATAGKEFVKAFTFIGDKIGLTTPLQRQLFKQSQGLDRQGLIDEVARLNILRNAVNRQLTIVNRREAERIKQFGGAGGGFDQKTTEQRQLEQRLNDLSIALDSAQERLQRLNASANNTANAIDRVANSLGGSQSVARRPFGTLQRGVSGGGLMLDDGSIRLPTTQMTSGLKDVTLAMNESADAAAFAALRHQQAASAIVTTTGSLIGTLIQQLTSGGFSVGGLLQGVGGLVSFANPLAGAALFAGGSILSGITARDGVPVRVTRFDDAAEQLLTTRIPIDIRVDVVSPDDPEHIRRTIQKIRRLDLRDGGVRIPGFQGIR